MYSITLSKENRSRRCSIGHHINSQMECWGSQKTIRGTSNCSSTSRTSVHLRKLRAGLSLFMSHWWSFPFPMVLQHCFPTHIPLPNLNGLFPCAFQQPITLFSGLCCANYHQVSEPSCLSSEAILDPVLMMSHWPRGWHQCGLCPGVGSFAWGNQQDLALKDQGQWSNRRILYF